MKNIFSYFYTCFLKLDRFHKASIAHSSEKQLVIKVLEIDELSKCSDEDFIQIDEEVTAQGEVYRGIGVFVVAIMFVVLQLAIYMAVFAAVPNETKLKVIKFGLMGLAIVIITVVSHWKVRDEWIQKRLRAEQFRYRALALLLSQQSSSPTLDTDMKLANEMRDILKGKEAAKEQLKTEGQIAYHHRKNTQYEDIEHCLEKLTFLCFILSMACLLGSVVTPVDYKVTTKILVLFTIALPCTVASLHAAAAFLKLSELSMNHISMHQKLRGVYEWLNRHSKGEISVDSKTTLQDKGKELQQLLLQGDLAWTKVAIKHNLVKGL
jgi:hypothetical protein